jgi:hypothetical protein
MILHVSFFFFFFLFLFFSLSHCRSLFSYYCVTLIKVFDFSLDRLVCFLVRSFFRSMYQMHF